jgi:hypothetical protein
MGLQDSVAKLNKKTVGQGDNLTGIKKFSTFETLKTSHFPSVYGELHRFSAEVQAADI